MSPSHPVSDPDTHVGWQAIDAVLDDIERWSASVRPDDEFWDGLLERLSGLGFVAATVWLANGQGTAEVVRTSRWRTDGESQPARPEPILTAWQSGATQLLDGEQPRSIVAPWRIGDAPDGALQVWLHPEVSLAGAKGFVRLLEAIGGLIAAFRLRQEQQRLKRRLEQQMRLDEFSRRLHEQPELNETAYRIANDGRVLLGCDRVSVLVRRGRRCKTLAISGAEHLHPHADGVHRLERLAACVVATGQAVATGRSSDERPPQIETALAEYLDASPARDLVAIPLTIPRGDAAEHGVIGVLVCEQYTQPFDTTSRELIDGLVGHCSLALHNALNLDAIPLHRLWISLSRDGRFSRRAAALSLAALLLVAAVVALWLVPAEVRVKARGELQPARRPEVFAPRDGVVTQVFVDHGQTVRAGDKLVEMRSLDLDLELQKVQGELETTRKQLAAAQSERLQIRPGEPDSRLRQRRLTADEEQFQEQVRGLEQRQKMLQQQQTELTVCSPTDGEVLTWNAKQRLSVRPLRRGDALLTIGVPDGPWQLELRVPGRSAGRVVEAHARTSAQTVSFAVSTDPGVRLQGTVSAIAERMETDERGESFVLVTVDVPREALPHRVPGATAVAHIDCGRGSLGEAWFHELVDAVRLWLAF